MSWQLAAFSILAFALAAGFAWYERTKPDARIIALVATLAAFAALGRIAFAATPNVKPTTDIVLIAGYALGGGPGFVVGAVAGLTSNFFFGQGPWTPWQMAGWGVTGVLGALLAIATRQRMNRLSLAVVCGIVGFGFTVLQDVGDWVTYSDHSAAALGVYVGKGIGFDFVHAGGCVAFALLLGPALVNSVQRFARRLEVSWRPARGVAAGVMVVILGAWLASQPGLGGGGEGEGDALAATTPTGYLLGAQQTDGGFGATAAGPSSELFSGWAALGLAAEGHSPQDVTRGGHSVLDYVRGGSVGDPGSLERTILVIRAAGLSAGSLVSQLERSVRSDGSVSDQVNLTAFAVLALRSAGVAPSSRTLSWLTHQQDGDGGFNFATAGGSSDVDDTGAALQALAGSAPGGTIARAVRFVDAQQNPDGGFPADPGAASNAQSTAWAVQGLLAAGTGGAAIQRADGYLQSLISSDGHIRYSSASDQTPVWVTGQAVMALAGKPLPLAPVPRTASGSQPAPGRGSPRVAHSSATHARHAARARKRVRARHRLDELSALAADAGLAAALVFAPIGQ